MTGWDPACLELVRLLAGTARGPRREGLFALWLTVRVTQDLQLVPPPIERSHKRRVAALEHRLATLTLPPQLRRALSAALIQLRNPKPDTAADVLSLLTAPVRDGVGADAGDVIAAAGKAAKAKTPHPRPHPPR
ncbi:MAG TPA: hypothetical protein VGP80_02260 [Gemmatimonadales bacterium]|nr:hypothetical protein [Gemmatimonadales bacterium]